MWKKKERKKERKRERERERETQRGGQKCKDCLKFFLNFHGDGDEVIAIVVVVLMVVVRLATGAGSNHSMPPKLPRVYSFITAVTSLLK